MCSTLTAPPLTVTPAVSSSRMVTRASVTVSPSTSVVITSVLLLPSTALSTMPTSADAKVSPCGMVNGAGRV